MTATALRSIGAYFSSCLVGLVLNHVYSTVGGGYSELSSIDTIKLLLAFQSIAFVFGAVCLLLLERIAKSSVSTLCWLVFGSLLPLTLQLAPSLENIPGVGVFMPRLPFSVFLAIPGVATALLAFVIGRVLTLALQKRASAGTGID